MPIRYAFHRRVQIVVTGTGPPKWTQERRVRAALANNNRGLWFVVQTNKTVADIERRFTEQSVATLLHEVVGGVLGDHRKLKSGDGGHYLYMQLSRVDGDVTMCLDDYLDVYVLQSIPFTHITNP